MGVGRARPNREPDSVPSSAELRPGDRVVLEDGQQWEVVDHPEVFEKGKAQRVDLRRRGDDPPESRTEHIPAHERVRVPRG